MRDCKGRILLIGDTVVVGTNSRLFTGKITKILQTKSQEYRNLVRLIVAIETNQTSYIATDGTQRHVYLPDKVGPYLSDLKKNLATIQYRCWVCIEPYKAVWLFKTPAIMKLDKHTK